MTRASLLLIGILSVFVSGEALGQGATGSSPLPGTTPSAPAPPPILTLFTLPEDADIRLKGETDLAGRTPLDVPGTVSGRYSIIITGGSFARTQGVIYMPQRGGLPFVLSEPREGSMGLFLRGLNYPGVPDLSSGRESRGIALAATATGGLAGAVRAHLAYRDRLNEVGAYAADRATDERRQRNDWLIFSGGVWALSAIDYWIRPRIDLAETTPTRLSLDVPQVNRFGAAWRSLFVPGAGQEFANHRTRSVVWLSGVLLAGAGAVVADYLVQRGETNVKWAGIAVSSAGPSELPGALLKLEQEERDLDDRRDFRRGLIVAALSIHALNFMDAMIMPLTIKPPSRPKVSEIRPMILPGSTVLAMTVRF
jgi:hypothetical protein